MRKFWKWRRDKSVAEVREPWTMAAEEMVREALRGHFKREVPWQRATVTIMPPSTSLAKSYMISAERDEASDHDRIIRFVQIDVVLESPNGQNNRVSATCRVYSVGAGVWEREIIEWKLDGGKPTIFRYPPKYAEARRPNDAPQPVAPSRPVEVPRATGTDN